MVYYKIEAGVHTTQAPSAEQLAARSAVMRIGAYSGIAELVHNDGID